MFVSYKKLPINIYIGMYISDDDDGETCAKLPKLNEEDYKETEESWIDNYQPYESMFEPDETSSSAAVGYNPTSSNSLPPPPNPLADRYDSSVPPPPVPVPVLPDPALAAVLAAKAMIESQLPPPSATPGMYVLLGIFCLFWLLFGTFCNRENRTEGFSEKLNETIYNNFLRSLNF